MSFLVPSFLALFTASDLLMMGSKSLLRLRNPLDLHQSVHGGLIGHQGREGLVINVHQQDTFPVFGQKGGGGPRHDNIQHFPGVDLTYGAAVVGNHRQEADELRCLLLRIAFVDVEAAAVIGDLPQCTI